MQISINNLKLITYHLNSKLSIPENSVGSYEVHKVFKGYELHKIKSKQGGVSVVFFGKSKENLYLQIKAMVEGIFAERESNGT